MGAKITEAAFNKARADLEAEASALAKGDELEDADPEGGFGHEGTPLSKKAPKGKGDAAKAMSASDMGSGDEDASSDDDDDKDKGNGKQDDASGDGDDDDAEAMSKSFREDETVQRAVEVSEFLEALVDQNVEGFVRLHKSLSGNLRKSDARVIRVEDMLLKSTMALAKGMTIIAKRLDDLTNRLNSTAAPPRPRGILNKSEVVQHPTYDNDGNEQITRKQMSDWLVQKAAINEIPDQAVIQFEINGYNPETLAPNIKERMFRDLRGNR